MRLPMTRFVNESRNSSIEGRANTEAPGIVARTRSCNRPIPRARDREPARRSPGRLVNHRLKVRQRRR